MGKITGFMELARIQEASLPPQERALAASGKGRRRHADRHDEAIVRDLCERHLRFTGSTLALALLDDWDNARARFVKVFPNEYKRALAEMQMPEEKSIPAVPEPGMSGAARKAVA